jgi:hypothetical protein
MQKSHFVYLTLNIATVRNIENYENLHFIIAIDFIPHRTDTKKRINMGYTVFAL